MLSKFRTENWSNLNIGERYKALQEIEHALAEEQGRYERQIQLRHFDIDEDGVTLGEYDSNSSKIYINEDFLTDKNVYFNQYFNQYHALCNICHEGRHAYQHDTMNENKVFEHNLCGGYQNDPRPDYRFQPIEDDAYNYAGKKMKEFSFAFEGDPVFAKYQKDNELVNRADVRAAEAQYGENYREEIQLKVERDYLASQQSAIQYNDSLNASASQEQSASVEHDKSAYEFDTQSIAAAGQSY